MGFYNYLVGLYNNLLSVFPEQVHWLISLVIVFGFAYLFISLIRSNILFVILLIIMLPFLLPVLVSLLSEIWQFFIYVLPKTQP